MLAKLATYSAALELSAFSLAQIAEQAGVGAASAQTVLSRLQKDHPEALDTSTVATNQVGKPRNQYKLTPTGRALLEDYVQQWSSAATFSLPGADRQDARQRAEPAVPPAGLVLAEAALAELSRGSVDSAGLTGSIRRNLRWAGNELEGRTSREDWQRRIAVVESGLAEWQSKYAEHAAPVAVQPAAESLLGLVRLQADGVPAMQVVTLGSEDGAAQVAESVAEMVNGVVKAYESVSAFGMPSGAVSQESDDHVRRWLLDRTDAFEPGTRIEFLCVDSSGHLERSRRDLQNWIQQSAQCTRVVIDKAPDPVLHAIVKGYSAAYFSNATGKLDWLPTLAQIAQQWFEMVNASKTKMRKRSSWAAASGPAALGNLSEGDI